MRKDVEVLLMQEEWYHLKELLVHAKYFHEYKTHEKFSNAVDRLLKEMSEIETWRKRFQKDLQAGIQRTMHEFGRG